MIVRGLVVAGSGVVAGCVVVAILRALYVAWYPTAEWRYESAGVACSTLAVKLAVQDSFAVP